MAAIRSSWVVFPGDRKATRFLADETTTCVAALPLVAQARMVGWMLRAWAQGGLILLHRRFERSTALCRSSLPPLLPPPPPPPSVGALKHAAAETSALDEDSLALYQCTDDGEGVPLLLPSGACLHVVELGDGAPLPHATPDAPLMLLTLDTSACVDGDEGGDEGDALADALPPFEGGAHPRCPSLFVCLPSGGDYVRVPQLAPGDTIGVELRERLHPALGDVASSASLFYKGESLDDDMHLCELPTNAIIHVGVELPCLLFVAHDDKERLRTVSYLPSETVGVVKARLEDHYGLAFDGIDLTTAAGGALQDNVSGRGGQGGVRVCSWYCWRAKGARSIRESGGRGPPLRSPRSPTPANPKTCAVGEYGIYSSGATLQLSLRPYPVTVCDDTGFKLTFNVLSTGASAACRVG